MGGTELVYNLFSECRVGSGNTHSGLCVVDPGTFEKVWPVARAILAAMVVKSALTIVTFGIKVPAGIFIPTLGVGACAGRVLGISMQWLQLTHPDSRLFKSCRGDLDCKHLPSFHRHSSFDDAVQASFPVYTLWLALPQLYLE